ncbi:MAG: right-handed parallel beta-helix repeat-containing protein, partial [Elusimicrobia bacterium]|nr:right-handed parallel beta-helix repeat-containing protein [Elusimicrobiota bacterium]
MFVVFLCACAVNARPGALSAAVKQFPPEITSDAVFSGKVYLNGDCIIREGARVRILPGTEIIPGGEKFSRKYTKRIGKRNIDAAITGKPVIIVEGFLEAEYGKGLITEIGKLDDNGGPGGIRWGGIVVAEKGCLSLHGAKICDAVYGILACDEAVVHLNKIEIKNCGIGLISANDADVKIKNSEISAHATSGIELYGRSRVEAQKCRIFSNRQSGVMARHRSRVALSDCEITLNSKGIHIKDAAKADLKENLFHANVTDIDSLQKYETKPLPAGKEGVLWRGMVEIKEDFLVPFGSTLRIEEGTKIFVSSYSARDLAFFAETASGKTKITSEGLCDLIIEGDIIVSGSRNKPVIFAAHGAFGSVIMSGRGASSSVKNLVCTGRGTGFIITDENAVKFKDSVFEDFFAGCVISEGARPSFDDCRFSNCRYGVLVYDSARPFFTGCAFTSCVISAGMRGQVSPFFRNCVFEKNETALTAAGEASPDCSASSVRENTNGFIFFEKSSGKISDNTFVKNNYAVKLKDSSFAEIKKNAFIKNNSAVLMDASSSSETRGNSFIKNGSGCEYALTVSPTLAGVMSANEVWGGEMEISGDI